MHVGLAKDFVQVELPRDFGPQPLHCGLVLRVSHDWVHSNLRVTTVLNMVRLRQHLPVEHDR